MPRAAFYLNMSLRGGPCEVRHEETPHFVRKGSAIFPQTCHCEEGRAEHGTTKQSPDFKGVHRSMAQTVFDGVRLLHSLRSFAMTGTSRKDVELKVCGGYILSLSKDVKPAPSKHRHHCGDNNYPQNRPGQFLIGPNLLSPSVS